MILVIGATGTNGRELVGRLVAAGSEVRALVRDPSRAVATLGDRVELTRGDLDDPEALDAALDGVDRVFVSAAVSEDAPRWSANVLDALRRAPTPPHVVRLSAMGAYRDSPVELLRQHGEADEALIESGLPVTLLRPNGFYQNLLGMAGTIKSDRALYQPMGDSRQGLVDVRDIAAVAESALHYGPGDGSPLTLTGPAALSCEDIARTFSDVLGASIRYKDVPMDATLAAMAGSGMSPWTVHALGELLAYFAAGRAAEVTGDVERATGRPPIALRSFIEDHADAFR